ncbi:pre-mRNA-splicing factor syf2-like [Watersipora subatra]|uniref:pre-mRNA-splicing factor syf2-like n=1 Tax=Watersipora subatra TaxID=2589382 RepID=UPI00355BE8B5
MATAGTSASSSALTAEEKKNERLQRLRELQLKRNEARKLNHGEVVEEDKRNKEPANIEAKRKRLDWEEQEAKKKKECKEKGLDYDRMKLLEVQADEAERTRNRKKKANPLTGFSTYEDMTARQNTRLTKLIKPDMKEYAEKKEKMGDAFYADVDTLGLEEMHKDTEEGIDKMCDDLEKQIEKRAKYTRRRTHDDDADIDYINTRNAKFNKKLERFYGKYTTEIKQNLERGTAL